MKLKLWLSTSEGDDLDVFVAAQKLDASGRVVGFNFFSTFAEGPAALGWLRVSHRETDPDRSTIFQPWLPHRHTLPVEPGQIVAAEIELWPSSTQFDAGESLRIVVGGGDLYRFNTGEPELRHPTINRGQHTIHTGGIYDAHLIVPSIRRLGSS
jgi:predicted acyl esterase